MGPWALYEGPHFGLYEKPLDRKGKLLQNEKVSEVALNVSDT